jgi:iron-sulfur cluster repair protein YtfE (RIC family)
MSIFEDVINAVKPRESQEDRTKARQDARALAASGDWLSAILDHHEQIEEAFAAVKRTKGEARKDALKKLGVLLTGHAIAEEAVVYPAMAESGDKRHAGHGYKEQATVKIEMAELEKLPPSSEEFVEKLEAIEEAVAHHVYEEETTWFPALKQAEGVDQALIGRRYKEEYERYAGEGRALLR